MAIIKIKAATMSEKTSVRVNHETCKHKYTGNVSTIYSIIAKWMDGLAVIYSFQ